MLKSEDMQSTLDANITLISLSFDGETENERTEAVLASMMESIDYVEHRTVLLSTSCSISE
jgi:hypothetical protein